MNQKPFLTLLLVLGILAGLALPAPAAAQADDPAPPAQPVKLIFIHHSTGENWLTDGYGNLGLALAENNYFVSDTNYGWGPDSIGDRTDIPDWPEWFRSENTPVYMDALFNESEQHAGYSRSFGDPGGENEIIIFKSCFPNSALEGSPDDPPDAEGWLSVGHAKYVYNDILQYFATRPDKLFIVITAPPLSDPTYADNARAFTDWLVNDWLSENNYSLNNVAVFDFYNVLTAADAHHWYNNGLVEHIVRANNTLAYPSGDDHPSEAGSQKATDEFVPLLNVFYNRWRAAAPIMPPPAPPASAGLPPSIPPSNPPEVNQPGTQTPAGMIDDFEAASPLSANGWEFFWDEATPTQIACERRGTVAHNGARALWLDYAVAANSWATCALMFDQPQDWSAGAGLAFYLRAGAPGLVFDINLYRSTAAGRETYLFTVESPAESAAGWVRYELTWEQFTRAAWEEDAGAAFSHPAEIEGLAFGLSTFPDTPNTGQIWLDDLQLMTEAAGQTEPGAPATEEPVEAAPAATEPPAAAAPETAAPVAQESQPPRRLCAGSIALPLALVGAGVALKRRLKK